APADREPTTGEHRGNVGLAALAAGSPVREQHRVVRPTLDGGRGCGRTGRRRGGGRHRARCRAGGGGRPRARAICVAGVEGAVEAEGGSAGDALLALRRRLYDRRLDLPAFLVDAADGGVQLPADGRILALHDELATRLLGDEGRQVRQLQRALHAL